MTHATQITRFSVDQVQGTKMVQPPASFLIDVLAFSNSAGACSAIFSGAVSIGCTFSDIGCWLYYVGTFRLYNVRNCIILYAFSYLSISNNLSINSIIIAAAIRIHKLAVFVFPYWYDIIRIC